MFIGKLHQSNLIVLVGLFFAAAGIGFAFHSELQYALVSLIIATIADLFVGSFMNQLNPTVAVAAFAKELKTLSSFAIYGLLPAVYMMSVAKASSLSLVVFALYILAVGIRLAYLNQSGEFQDPVDKQHTLGLPLELGVFVIPVFSFLGFVIPVEIFQYLLMLIFLILGVAYIYKIRIPRLPSQWLFYMLAVQILLCVLWVWWGSFIPIT